MAEGAGENSPHLDEAEQRQAREHAAPKALVIHEVVREEGENELGRNAAQLAWSGLAAGLSMGFSLLTLAFLESALPDTPWRILLAAPGYSIGFLIAILGKQQLFTESTLTAMLPFFVKRDVSTFWKVAKLWVIVLISNLVGTWIIAGLFSLPGLFDAPVRKSIISIGEEVLAGPWWAHFIKSMFAGWLIALMVWLLPSSRSARFFVILTLTYVVAVGHFPHIVAGSVDAAVTVFAGTSSVRDYLLAFFVPTLLGNSLGGVALAALLNHAPVAGELSGRDEEDEPQGEAAG